MPPEEFLYLAIAALNGFEADDDSVKTVASIAQRNGKKLPPKFNWRIKIPTGNAKYCPYFTYTFRKFLIAPKWELPIIFALDALPREVLEAIIKGVNAVHSYPDNGQVNHFWGSYEQQMETRLLQKLLLNRPKEFKELDASISRFNQFSVRKLGNPLALFFSVFDYHFWSKRHFDFIWLTLAEHFKHYPTWGQYAAQELERIINLLRPDIAPQDYPNEIRIVAVMGMHYFQERPEFFDFDPGLRGLCYLLSGSGEEAAKDFTSILQRGQREEADLIDVIALLYCYGKGHLDKAAFLSVAGTFRRSAQPLTINCFLAFVLHEKGEVEKGEALLFEQIGHPSLHPTAMLMALWSAAWMGIKLRPSQVDNLRIQLAKGELQGLPWLSGELLHALGVLFPGETFSVPTTHDWARPQVPGESSLLHLIPVKPAWAYALRQLASIGTSKEKTSETNLRTIWIIDFDAQEAYCKEQKQGKSGWTKGRRLKTTDLLHYPHPEVLDPADVRSLAAVRSYDGRRLSTAMSYQNDMLVADFAQMLHEIADHPRIYMDENRRIPVELIRSTPELQVTETAEGILLRFDPPIDAAGYRWQKETPTRYRIYHLTEEQAKLGWAIGSKLELPADQRPALEGILEKVRPLVQVQSTFDLIDEDLEVHAGSPLPCFHLLPFGEGYKVELHVKPLPAEPFYFQPGEGLPRSIIVLEDGRHILERPLAEELARAEQAIASCPTLTALPHPGFEWTVENTQAALRILLELRRLVTQGDISIEHPRGEKLRIVGNLGSDELAIRVGKQRDWFEVDGKLTVDENRVLDLQLVLEHLQSDQSNFIELAEGQFVALTDELRDRILEMEGLLHRKGEKFQLPVLAATAFSELTEGLQDLELDEAWNESLERIRTANNIRPRVPKEFLADLRDYQKEGFRWMMRLAAWGVGGCLADDMGLGKTVQALAVLTARAHLGPSLVIAPASVTRNWQRETERFAPSLQPILIATRQDTPQLSQLGPNDLALVSYGLLPFIGEELAAIPFANIVLDEAQAIKNAATKRAKTVQDLQGDFKLATTGTPIENHLGELWSLFRFLNPGLLLGKQAFNEKYNRPIARDGNAERQRALKNLVQPFILRRRKDEVLTELPPKTEIILEVELSEEEKALYEAMRRQAVEAIAAAEEQQRRFTVLAQLTKLRQAACHPRLVRPTSKLGSAKLELVGETLLEILESGHKALVFSQFVKHLKIVENWVKGQRIPYQYLDGSTPGAQREAAVNAFQGGEGDVFLISLKAGGTGLNLTAADYVLHLDPWWNPAVEDQASDRAHRIGQQRPVTVYRFVSQGTIEERIISLHREKRDLADQILSGTGNAGALEVDEILAMIRE
ncbi:DEAD/DEAH box helicase [Neolewinella lacunae]|uniref:DEAD/DEAH box helicase n=1 Tax=Neolewinella lacunae TaxID=1517758 RepID=UPI001CA4092F|nr:DEAD/DEAH box helicase [Neolewinella lacunae]